MIKRDVKHRGVVLHLYRQIDFSAHDFEASNVGGEGTNTSFGNFDRLRFSPVSNFTDYLKQSSKSSSWNGGRKDILMYPLDHGEPAIYSNAENVPFLIVTMFYLTEKAKAQVGDYGKLLQLCRDGIERISKEYRHHLREAGEKGQLAYQVYGTFESAQLAVIWTTDQFVNVQYLVDQLRYMTLETEPLFSAAYTIVALTGVPFPEHLKGGAMIQLASGTVRDTQMICDNNVVVNHLNSLASSNSEKATFCVMPCVGEYDYIINSTPPQLNLFVSEKKVNGDKFHVGELCNEAESFRRFFSCSTTRLYYRREDIPNQIWDDPTWSHRLCVKADSLCPLSNLWNLPLECNWEKEEYEKFRLLVQNSSEDASSFCINLDLLYKDFARAVHTSPNRQWVHDLKTQFTAALHLLQSFRDEANPEKIWMDMVSVKYFNDVFRLLRQQIHHVNEAGKFSFEEPGLYAEDTSEYDLLLHMYYGAVKEILTYVYGKEEDGRQGEQSELIPLIHFELAPKVSSELYFEQPGVNRRLVDISMPYDAWGEPEMFIQYLIHEIYHYAAPVDRDMRNRLFSQFVVCEVLANALIANVIEEYSLQEQSVPSISSVTMQSSCWELLKKNIREIFRKNKTNKPDVSGASLYTAYDEDLFEIALATVIHILRRQLYRELKKIDIPLYIEKEKNLVLKDCAWQEFFAALSSWYCMEEGGSAEGHNFGSVLLQVLPMVCSDLMNECRDIGVCEYDIAVLLNNAVSKPIGKSRTIADYIRKQHDAWVLPLVSKLREIFPDCAMVKLCGLDSLEYVLAYVVLQEKLNNTIAFQENHSLEVLRIGCVLDMLLEQELLAVKSKNLIDNSPQNRCELFKNKQTHFVKMYCAYMNNCGWGNTRNESILCESANEWFHVFKGILSDYYSQYDCYQFLLVQLRDEQFLPRCYPKQESRLSRAVTGYYDALLHENAEEALFKNHIQTIQIFQCQPFLQELRPVSPAASSEYSQVLPEASHFVGVRKADVSDTVWTLSEAENLQKMITMAFHRLDQSHKEIFGKSLTPTELWFRGVSSVSYEVIPSVMVHFLDDSNLEGRVTHTGKNIYGFLWQYQRNLCDRFKYQADGAGEIINPDSYTVPDYLALMQHYQQYTNLLDWSEDAFSSLYFALEDYCDNKDKKPGEEEKEACLLILDPVHYNFARKQMVRESPTDSECWRKIQNGLLNAEENGYIPNLSDSNIEKNLSMFSMKLEPRIVKRMREKEKTYHQVSTKDTEKITIEDCLEELSNLPIAVHTSRLNPRIRCQSGQFMAFSPFALPAYGKDDNDYDSSEKPIRSRRYAYMSLRSIQEYYLRTNENAKPFMYEIRIGKENKRTLATFLRNVGINRYRIYPELTHMKL